MKKKSLLEKKGHVRAEKVQTCQILHADQAHCRALQFGYLSVLAQRSKKIMRLRCSRHIFSSSLLMVTPFFFFLEHLCVITYFCSLFLTLAPSLPSTPVIFSNFPPLTHRAALILLSASASTCRHGDTEFFGELSSRHVGPMMERNILGKNKEVDSAVLTTHFI